MMEDAVTRRAKDGSMLWRCRGCGVYLARDLFPDHMEDEPQCLACQIAGATPDEGMYLQWLVGPLPPEEDAVFRRKAVWHRVRKYLRAYRVRSNQRRASMKDVRERALDKILFYTKQTVPASLRQPTLEVLSGYDLGAKDSMWLAMRSGLLSKAQLRVLALGCASQVCAAFKLNDLYSGVDLVLRDVALAAAYPESRTFNVPRHNAFSIRREMEKAGDRTTLLRAGDALMATCFPRAYDAAAVAMSASCEAYVDNREDEATALASINDEVRKVAEEALKEYIQPTLEHWNGLETI